MTAFAIVRLPGRGGHLPANGLAAGVTQPIDLPGVVLAGLATIGLGLVLGPEAPLIALGGGLGLLAIRLARRDVPSQVGVVLAAAGTFAAMALIFGSPIIAAVILIEAAGLGGPTLPLVLLPGLLAAGIGSLVSIGMGSFTGLSTSAYALGALSLPTFARPDIADFGWTHPAGDRRRGRQLRGLPARSTHRPGGGAATLRARAGRGPRRLRPGDRLHGDDREERQRGAVLRPGRAPGAGLGGGDLVAVARSRCCSSSRASAWAISLGSFRGGPTFPAIFLGAAGGLMAAQLPGYSITPAVAVAIGAAVASVLRLPLSAVVLATVLTASSGIGAMPLVIVGVVVAYVMTSFLSGPGDDADPAAAGEGTPAGPRP